MMEVPGLQICFPLEDPRRLLGFQESRSEAGEKMQRKPRVLVVDDERLLANTTAAILGGAGYNVRTAYDGFEALDVIGCFRPDYLLTDILMPGMNGVELAVSTARMFPETRILLVSGQAGILDILEQSRAGGYDFPLLAKPVHPLRLIETLRSLKDD